MCELLATLKFLRSNYVHFKLPEQCVYEALSTELRPLVGKKLSNRPTLEKKLFFVFWQGLANRTAEKAKPGPLELTLFFKDTYDWFQNLQYESRCLFKSSGS